MSKFYNILGSVGVDHELIAPGAANDIKSISIANLHDTNDATVSLFIQDDPISGSTSTFNIVYKIAIPAVSTLLLDDSSMFLFGEEFGLYANTGSSDTLDIIVNQ
tara:strand:- start:774 stop:1088 length:315 start_codon:yes stop_codon:yes gene_type:complete